MAAQIGQRAADADMIIDQNIGRAWQDRAGEGGGSDDALERPGPRMPDLVRLHDLAGHDLQIKVAAEYLSHCIGDRVEARILVGDDRKQQAIAVADQLFQPGNAGIADESDGESESRIRVARFRRGITLVDIPVVDRGVDDDIGKARRPRRSNERRGDHRAFHAMRIRIPQRLGGTVHAPSTGSGQKRPEDARSWIPAPAGMTGEGGRVQRSFAYFWGLYSMQEYSRCQTDDVG